MNNLAIRSITGSIIVLCIAGSIIFSSYITAILLLIVNILAINEFIRMARSNNIHLSALLINVFSITIFLLMTFYKFNLIPIHWFLLFLLFLPLLSIAELHHKNENPFAVIGISIFAGIYITVPLALLLFLEHTELAITKYSLLLGFFIILWTYDSMAYVFGLTLGKHRLFERISPKKSWEGAIGGGFSALLAAALLAKYFPCISIIQWLIFALIIIIFGTYGDLTESLLKRTIKSKDSGNILPGHGGIMDRFDGVFLASPVLIIYLYLFVF